MDLLKQKEIEKLLREAYKYRNLESSFDEIINLTRNYGLKQEDLQNLNPKETISFFSKWSKYTRDTLFNKSRLNGKCYSTDNWWGIRTDNYDYNGMDNYKIYLPLDYNHLEKGVKILIEYFKKNDIPVDMKVSSKMRCDNVVIRVMGYQNVLQIINFIEHNNYLSTGKNKLSPFVPNFNTVGLVKDKGSEGSYNATIGYDISGYIKQKDSLYTYSDFINYLKNQPPHYIFNDDMQKYFGYQNEYRKKENITGNKIEIQSFNKKTNIKEKAELLTTALCCTYKKYNNELYLEKALLEAINNNYSYFTRNIDSNSDINLRKNLIQSIQPNEIRPLMIYILEQKDVEINYKMTDQQLAFLLSNSLFEKTKVEKNNRKL